MKLHFYKLASTGKVVLCSLLFSPHIYMFEGDYYSPKCKMYGDITVRGKIKNPLCMFISTLITISSHLHDGGIHDYGSERR